MSKQRQRGATLVELLATITIIAILAGLLLAAVSKAKRTTERAQRAYAWRDMQISGALDDRLHPQVFEWLLTNQALPVLTIVSNKVALARAAQ